MTPLDLAAFAELPGSVEGNWELVCRAAIKRNYERFGLLRAHRQQPGVEFHLLLHHRCELGESGDWWGWQCKWYDLGQQKNLGVRRRQEIENAIRLTEKHVPKLTDWVLWLRETPRKADVEWFDGLSSQMHLRMWTATDLDDLLVGDAAVVRAAYFGELVMTPGQLDLAQQRAVEPVKRRWIPEVHVEVPVERDLRRALAEPQSWASLRGHSERLADWAGNLGGLCELSIAEEERQTAVALVDGLSAFSQQGFEIVDAVDGGRPQDAGDAANDPFPATPTRRELNRLTSRLRSCRDSRSLVIDSAIADLLTGMRTIEEARRLFAAPLIAVVGEANFGKSFLAAELTAVSGVRPAGVLLLGSELARSHTLDDLARRLPGLEVDGFDRLIEAIDAAGARARRRLPIVIDGLNEAEDPLRWRTLLGQLSPILTGYPNVLLVVTLRTDVAEDALIDAAVRVTLRGFEHKVDEAVDRYFAYYLIDPGGSPLPWRLFRNPLFLRMFCEATNPDRAHLVGVEALPRTLGAVVERYRDATAARVREHLNVRGLALPPTYVNEKLEDVALELWSRNTRSLPIGDLQQLLGDDTRAWDVSLRRALEEEGILWRQSTGQDSEQRGAVLFDLFAGFLIADALVSSASTSGIEAVFSDPATWERLSTKPGQGHPLASDILVGLADVLPRRTGRHLWTLAPDERRGSTLVQTIGLEARYLDDATIDALASHIERQAQPARGRRDIFERLFEVRDGGDHPLNAHFTDRVLRSMTVAQRDLRWSEWIRPQSTELLDWLRGVEEKWKECAERTESDRLNALWTAWLLTTTVRSLRDHATRALYWYGRGDPNALFELTLAMLDVDDPYVWERLLAASYGVTMAHQTSLETIAAPLTNYVDALTHAFGEGGQHGTDHWLAREYVLGTIEFADHFLPDRVQPAADTFIFASGPPVKAIDDSDPRADECNKTFGMDFENYTVGRLVEGRRNYDPSDLEYQAVLAEIRGRVWNLGWRASTFSDVDRQIADKSWRRDGKPGRIERYGKKYGWIAYFEAAGRLAASGRLRELYRDPERLPTVDIDPSFPSPPAPASWIGELGWIGDASNANRVWLRRGEIKAPDDLLYPVELEGRSGPWVLVDGWLRTESNELRRRVFGFFRAILVSEGDAEQLVDDLSTRPYLGNEYVPDNPSDYYTFAGEIPWSRRFASEESDYQDLRRYEVPIDHECTPEAIIVERLAHNYAWESYHSVVNEAGNTPVPAKELALTTGLRSVPQTFEFVDAEGVAAVTYGAPHGFSDGHLLYVRQDVLWTYAPSGRALVLLAWGERGIEFEWHNPPKWLVNASQKHEDLWRHVALLRPG